ncbi:MAG: SGNH/GDSL hydrolase family protein [Bacteroidetes bacterium]|nr:SGNH/GDSL hydrolase family protein [Bacteroidota bacterium]
MVFFLARILSFFLFIYTDFSSLDDQSTSKTQVNVVVLGSSTAEGAGASKLSNSWVFRLEQELKISNKASSVVNHGKSGYSTFHILPTGTRYSNRPNPDVARNITNALSKNPNLIIINMPSNDAAYGYSNEEQLRNYRLLIQMIKKRKIQYLLISPQPRNFKNKDQRIQQNALFQLMKKEFSPHFVDVWSFLSSEDFSLKPTFDSGDGIHLNDQGHAYIFQQVFAKINEIK